MTGERISWKLLRLKSGRNNNGRGRLVSSYQINAHFIYSITIYMLHYNPQHVSSITLLIFRRTNCIITASGIVTLYKRPYSMSSWRWPRYCSKHLEDYNV